MFRSTMYVTISFGWSRLRIVSASEARLRKSRSKSFASSFLASLSSRPTSSTPFSNNALASALVMRSPSRRLWRLEAHPPTDTSPNLPPRALRACIRYRRRSTSSSPPPSPDRSAAPRRRAHRGAPRPRDGPRDPLSPEPQEGGIPPRSPHRVYHRQPRKTLPRLPEVVDLNTSHTPDA